jgi:hypothetical protein
MTRLAIRVRNAPSIMNTLLKAYLKKKAERGHLAVFI